MAEGTGPAEFVQVGAAEQPRLGQPAPPEFLPADPAVSDASREMEDVILDGSAPSAGRRTRRGISPYTVLWIAGLSVFAMVAVKSIAAATIRFRGIQAGAGPGLAYLYVASLAILATLIVAVVVHFVFDYLRVAKNSRLRRMSDALANFGNPRLAIAYADKVAAKYRHHPSAAVSGGVRALRERLQVTVVADDILETVSKEILAHIDEDVKELIRQEAVRTAVSTTISPIAVVDMLLVAWRCTALQRGIAERYGYRPGLAGSLRLWGWSLGNMAYAGASQLVADYLGSTVVSGLLGKVVAQATQGMTTGIVTIRVGIAAWENCRPLALTREEKRGAIGIVFEGIKDTLFERFRLRDATERQGEEW